jgi:exodeoxyribonuclease V alpha subunit
MARELGHTDDSPARLSSGLAYVLRANAMQNGHVCLPEDKLLSAAQAMLGGTPEQLREALDILLFSGRLVRVSFGGTTYIYEKYAHECEQYIATKLRLLDRLCVAVEASDVHAFIDREERSHGIAYASLQRKAIFDALQCGVMILTGGPGTGKTTVVRALLHILGSMDLRVALAAPTGRAAKRLSESTQSEAKTIHRLLEMEYGDADGEGGAHFRRDETNLLEEDVIIIDEASMVGNGLMCSLLKAIKPGARLIIIGDADQLPSVEAGNVLRDLIDSGCFSTVCLTEIFRQAEESLIVTNAHAINRGDMPRLDVKNKDFFFLRRDTDREIVLTVADLYKNRLPRTYGEMTREGIQVISPSRKGEGGTENLNILLQEGLNPQSGGKAQYRYRDKVFREGDRVMQIRNNYELSWEKDDGSTGMGVFNGDIGIIEAINHASECMEIRFDDRHVVYDFSLLEDLELAYAITTHKSQGSEYRFVLLPAFQAAPMLMTRKILYTAVTRAKEMVCVVGDSYVLERMTENNGKDIRYTALPSILEQI